MLFIFLTFLVPGSTFGAGIPTPDGLRVLRGVGWSPWYPGTGWHRSPDVQTADLNLLRSAHINALRTWGPGSPRAAAAWGRQGFYLATQVGNGWWKKADVAPTRFADGKQHRFPSFADAAAVKAFRHACEAYAETVATPSTVVLSLLGNEFSWVGRNKRKDYVYAGFDDLTQAAFHRYLQQRFETVQRLNTLCGTHAARFTDLTPPGSGPLRYEWWRFLRLSFERFLKAGHEALKSVAPQAHTCYAKLMARWDPCCEDAELRFLDVGGQNLYWHWDKDWGRYVLHLKELVRHAGGKPVVITEAGFRTWKDPAEERRAARRMKQLLWNCFLQPETAGVFPFVFNDEWWVDGDPKSQSPGESWGLVTAYRKPKATHGSVAEVYERIARLNDALVHAKPSPRVALTCQDRDWAFAPESGRRVTALVRALLSQGIDFNTVYSRDLLGLDPASAPTLILCDGVLFRSPNGGEDAVAALFRYVARGGRVLYLSPTPFLVSYGEAHLPPMVQDTVDRMPEKRPARLRWGRGSFLFVRVKDLSPATAWQYVGNLPGLRRVVHDVRVVPADKRFEVFVFTLQVGARTLVGVVNESDEPVVSVTLRLPPGNHVPHHLFGSDGSTLVPGPGPHTLTLAPLNTYALLWEPS